MSRCSLTPPLWCFVASSASGAGVPGAQLPELAASGRRVHVRTIRAEDAEMCRRAVLASAARMRRWNPVNPDDLPQLIRAQSRDQRSFLVLADEPVEDQPVVGRINLNGVVRGRMRSVPIGYDAYDPYAGRGLFREGLALVIDLAFAKEHEGGLDLHRVEASVQPGNTRSAGLLRSLGFRHEGTTPRMLYLPDDSGLERWRDHERFAVTREEWPAASYAPHRQPRLVVLLDDGGTEAGRQVARAVALELGLPLVPLDAIAPQALSALVTDCPTGVVVAGPVHRAECEPQVVALKAGEPAAVLSSVASVTSASDARGVTRLALDLRAAGRRGT
jgi:ribosomal-protein-alanine N-acetyltransferase